MDLHMEKPEMDGFIRLNSVRWSRCATHLEENDSTLRIAIVFLHRPEGGIACVD